MRHIMTDKEKALAKVKRENAQKAEVARFNTLTPEAKAIEIATKKANAVKYVVEAIINEKPVRLELASRKATLTTRDAFRGQGIEAKALMTKSIK